MWIFRELHTHTLTMLYVQDPTLPDGMGISPYDRALKDHAGVQLYKEELRQALTEQNRKLNESLLREQLAARAVNRARTEQLDLDGADAKQYKNPFASVYEHLLPLRLSGSRAWLTLCGLHSARKLGRPSISTGMSTRKNSQLGSNNGSQGGSNGSLNHSPGTSTRSVFAGAGGSGNNVHMARGDTSFSLAAAVRMRIEDHSNVRCGVGA